MQEPRCDQLFANIFSTSRERVAVKNADSSIDCPGSAAGRDIGIGLRCRDRDIQRTGRASACTSVGWRVVRRWRYPKTSCCSYA